MSEMVDRVARAIWDDACPGMEWGDIDKLTYTGWARAAIEAMRVPTDAMLDYRDAFVKKSDALLVWQHQIDEALR